MGLYKSNKLILFAFSSISLEDMNYFSSRFCINIFVFSNCICIRKDNIKYTLFEGERNATNVIAYPYFIILILEGFGNYCIILTSLTI